MEINVAYLWMHTFIYRDHRDPLTGMRLASERNGVNMTSDALSAAVAKLVAEAAEDDEPKTTTLSLRKSTIKRLKHESARWEKSMSYLVEMGVGPLLDQLEATNKPGEQA